MLRADTQNAPTTASLSPSSAVTLFSVTSSSPTNNSGFVFSLQLPHWAVEVDEKKLPTTVEFVATEATDSNSNSPSPSPLRFVVPLPIESIIDNDAFTFDGNAQRSAIVSPSMAAAAGLGVRSLASVVVPSGPAPLSERINAAVAAAENNGAVGAEGERFVIVRWGSNINENSSSAASPQQPTYSPYAIHTASSGVAVGAAVASATSPPHRPFAAVPVAAFEEAARVIVDAAAAAATYGDYYNSIHNNNSDGALAASSSVADFCFGVAGADAPHVAGPSMGPQFFRAIRVPPEHANALLPNASTTAPTNASALRPLIPVDRIYWDSALISGSSSKPEAVTASSPHGHPLLPRKAAPAIATVRTDASDAARFAADRQRLLVTIENFGFAVLEDEALLCGIPDEGATDPATGALLPLRYVAPKKSADAAAPASAASSVAAAEVSNAAIVDHRAAAAERLITRVFGYARNCHYGLFATWSDGRAWRGEDFSCDAPLLKSIDVANARRGVPTQYSGPSGSAPAEGVVAPKPLLAATPKEKATTGQEEQKRLAGSVFANPTAPSPPASAQASATAAAAAGAAPHEDGAYSGCHLDLHTDSTYFVDPPRLQAFGCILTHQRRTIGGESVLVDGFRVALEAARLCDPNATAASLTPASRALTERYTVEERREFLRLLCSVPIAGRFEKEGHRYGGLRPVIALARGATPELLMRVAVGGPAPSSEASSSSSSSSADKQKEAHVEWCRRVQHALGPSRPLIESVSFNNSDRSPLSPFASAAFRKHSTASGDTASSSHPPSSFLVDAEAVRRYYCAYEWMHTLAHDPALAVHFTLAQGQMLFFDNTRALHGRLAFGGPRVMCGSYVAADEYYSTLKAVCDDLSRQSPAA